MGGGVISAVWAWVGGHSMSAAASPNHLTACPVYDHLALVGSIASRGLASTQRPLGFRPAACAPRGSPPAQHQYVGNIGSRVKLLASPGPPASGPTAAASAAGASRRQPPAALPAPAPPLRRCIPLRALPSIRSIVSAPWRGMEAAVALVMVVMGVMGCGKRCAGLRSCAWHSGAWWGGVTYCKPAGAFASRWFRLCMAGWVGTALAPLPARPTDPQPTLLQLLWCRPQHGGGLAGACAWGDLLRGRQLPPGRQHRKDAGAGWPTAVEPQLWACCGCRAGPGRLQRQSSNGCHCLGMRQ